MADDRKAFQRIRHIRGNSGKSGCHQLFQIIFHLGGGVFHLLRIDRYLLFPGFIQILQGKPAGFQLAPEDRFRLMDAEILFVAGAGRIFQRREQFYRGILTGKLYSKNGRFFYFRTEIFTCFIQKGGKVPCAHDFTQIFFRKGKDFIPESFLYGSMVIAADRFL